MFNVTQGEQITRYEYDLLGRLTKVITPDGAETTYTYDSMNRMTSVTGLDGEVFTKS